MFDTKDGVVKVNVFETRLFKLSYHSAVFPGVTAAVKVVVADGQIVVVPETVGAGSNVIEMYDVFCHRINTNSIRYSQNYCIGSGTCISMSWILKSRNASITKVP